MEKYLFYRWCSSKTAGNQWKWGCWICLWSCKITWIGRSKDQSNRSSWCENTHELEEGWKVSHAAQALNCIGSVLIFRVFQTWVAPGFAENKALLDVGRVLLILPMAESLVATAALPLWLSLDVNLGPPLCRLQYLLINILGSSFIAVTHSSALASRKLCQLSV